MDLKGIWIALDASCPTTQVALFKDGRLIADERIEAPAMQTLLESVRRVCQLQHHPISETNGFLYCSGPGSILGIRLSIMAIKTWCTLHAISEQQVFAYSSLGLAAAAYRKKENKENRSTPFIVCAEWRKDFWNVFACHEGHLNRAVEVWELQKIRDFPGNKLLLQQRKIWTPPPDAFIPVETSLHLFEDPNLRNHLLHPINNWEIYTPDEKQYATWSGDRHRG